MTSIAALEEQGFTTIDVLDIDHVTVGAYMRNTLRVDKNSIREDAPVRHLSRDASGASRRR